jgi:hypothetical protein
MYLNGLLNTKSDIAEASQSAEAGLKQLKVKNASDLILQKLKLNAEALSQARPELTPIVSKLTYVKGLPKEDSILDAAAVLSDKKGKGRNLREAVQKTARRKAVKTPAAQALVDAPVASTGLARTAPAPVPTQAGVEQVQARRVLTTPMMDRLKLAQGGQAGAVAMPETAGYAQTPNQWQTTGGQTPRAGAASPLVPDGSGKTLNDIINKKFSPEEELKYVEEAEAKVAAVKASKESAEAAKNATIKTPTGDVTFVDGKPVKGVNKLKQAARNRAKQIGRSKTKMRLATTKGNQWLERLVGKRMAPVAKVAGGIAMVAPMVADTAMDIYSENRDARFQQQMMEVQNSGTAESKYNEMLMALLMGQNPQAPGDGLDPTVIAQAMGGNPQSQLAQGEYLLQ